jgi:hypothetical protein
VATGACAAACAQIWGFDDLRPGDAGTPTTDGSSDGGGGDASTTCGAQWPAPPAQDDPNGRQDAGGDNGFIMVINALAVLKDLDGGPPNFGYDLDCVSTTGVNNSSCAVPPKAVSNIGDKSNGIDNNGAGALGQIAALGTVIRDSTFNASIQNGESTIMFRLYDYNAADDDTNVTFGVLGAPGTKLDAGQHPPPNLVDGGDRWLVDVNDVIPTTFYGPKLKASRAYVSKRKLVAIFDSQFTIALPTPYGRVRVTLDSAVVTGTLVAAPDDTMTIVNGLVVGRWRTSSVFDTVGNLNVMPFGLLCPNVHSIADSICGYVDIASNKLDDGKNKPCDALSVALQFTTVPALLATTVDAGVFVDMCEAGGDCPP